MTTTLDLSVEQVKALACLEMENAKQAIAGLQLARDPEQMQLQLEESILPRVQTALFLIKKVSNRRKLEELRKL